jgi:hypothetical protein
VAPELVPPEQIAPELWRWRAPLAESEPRAEPQSGGDRDRMVGSVLYELPDVAVLIDPLIQRDAPRFLDWLDRTIAGRPVSILTTIRWHRRDREELAARYRSQTPGAWNRVPRGVEPKPLRGAGETPIWLPVPAALVFGDRVIGGDGGELRVCPQSWLANVAVDRAGLARLLRVLIELPIERVVPSHGEPVLHDGRAALARAVAAV